MIHITWLYGLMLCLASEAGGAPAAFEFRDAAACEGRSVLQYRAVEFRSTPVRPLQGDFKEAEGARYGLVPVGPTPETALAIVWLPKAGGGEIWLDRNGDGRLAADEHYVVQEGQVEIPASITVELGSPGLTEQGLGATGGLSTRAALADKQPVAPVPRSSPVSIEPAARRVERTLIFRRSVAGDGLRYAVRGYAAGTLELSGTKYAAVLIDGNADGLFDTVGQDRVWIDLNQDGRFDLLTEQFLLGKPITKDGQIFVVSADATAQAVRARLRSGVEGKLRLQMAALPSTSPGKISAELVSDLGELLVIDKLGAAVSVLAGEYYVSSLKLEIPDPAGQTWVYSFRSTKREPFPVPAGQERVAALCGDLAMEVTAEGRTGQVRPAETVTIRPRLIADGSLYLSSCNIGSEGSSRAAEGSAEIVLMAPDGKEVSRGVTGFS